MANLKHPGKIADQNCHVIAFWNYVQDSGDLVEHHVNVYVWCGVCMSCAVS